MVGKSLYSAHLKYQLNPGPQERWRRVDVAANETIPALLPSGFQYFSVHEGHGMRGGMARKRQ